MRMFEVLVIVGLLILVTFLLGTTDPAIETDFEKFILSTPLSFSLDPKFLGINLGIIGLIIGFILRGSPVSGEGSNLGDIEVEKTKQLQIESEIRLQESRYEFESGKLEVESEQKEKDRAHKLQVAEKLAGLQPLLGEYLASLKNAPIAELLNARAEYHKELLEKFENENGFPSDSGVEIINGLLDSAYPLNEDNLPILIELKKLIELCVDNF